MARPGPSNSLSDVAGLSIGCAEDEHALTGVTVIVPDVRAVCAVDVRGGGPGTRETDALAPENLVDAVDALVLSGGSVYGLAAADGVAAAMGAEGRGFGLIDLPGVPRSPVIPAAILYDLANGGSKAWNDAPPYNALGRRAYAARGKTTPLGNVGAGLGAVAGALKGGQGSASIVSQEGFTVAALACVNCWGSTTMPNQRAFWAQPFEIDGEFGGVPAIARSFDLEDWAAPNSIHNRAPTLQSHVSPPTRRLRPPKPNAFERQALVSLAPFARCSRRSTAMWCSRSQRACAKPRNHAHSPSRVSRTRRRLPNPRRRARRPCGG